MLFSSYHHEILKNKGLLLSGSEKHRAHLGPHSEVPRREREGEERGRRGEGESALRPGGPAFTEVEGGALEFCGLNLHW